MPGETARINGQKGGRPKGRKDDKTYLKEAQKEAFRQVVFKHQEAILAAQVAHAQGVQHFVLRQKDGKFKKVESAEAAVAALNDPESVYEFWSRDPNTQAAAYLFDQALDKAAQPQQIDLNVSGRLEVVTSKLESARVRLAKRR